MVAANLVCVHMAAFALLPPAVWPPPRAVTCTGASGPTISSELQITLIGGSNDVARAATARYLPLLKEHSTERADAIKDIHVNVTTSSDTLDHTTDYSYSITTANGMLAIQAESPYAVAYALETLSQFIEAKNGALSCSSLAIHDGPAFLHRGIMIDTGRRFYPVALVKQTIEGMAMTKQNVLHFHLSEECFRVQSEVYPQLTAACVDKSKLENTAFYSKQDIADIVAFARLRGVRVLPEFDMVSLPLLF